jgi:peptide/nickel transport system substrate-binding protein
VDVPGIIEAAYDGKWTRANAIIPESMGVGFWADAPQYERDVEQAKSYLEQSGLTNVQLRLAVVNFEADQTAAQVIQQNLGDIGIKVDIQTFDNAAFNTIPGSGGGGLDRQLVYAGYITEPDPYWSTEWFTCAQEKLWNWGQWCSPEFDRLNEEAARELDPDKRTELYIQLQEVWDEVANMVWVAYRTNWEAWKTSIKPSVRPDGRPVLWDFRSV